MEPWVELSRTLVELGMWAHRPPDEAARAAAEVAGGGYPFDLPETDENHRYFFVDGESMAELGVEEHLEAMAEALAAHGVVLDVHRIEPPDNDREYAVSINGRPCRIWGPDDEGDWFTATVRPLSMVNDLLAAAGARPRLFTLYGGGNEGIAWLLDPGIVTAVARSGLVPDRELPRLAEWE